MNIIIEQNQGRWLCIIPRRWKRIVLHEYLRGAQTLTFKSYLPVRPTTYQNYDYLLVWGRQTKVPQKILDKNPQLKLITVEDGFITSAGLGITGAFYYSLLFDGKGVHYDASKPCDLESKLAHHQFTEKEQTRAEQLIAFIRENRLTKCNLSMQNAVRFPKDKKVILAVGQVEDDKSIRYGLGEIKTNIALVKAIRGDNPDAYIAFKPHPNYLKRGLFKSKHADSFLKYCDTIIGQADICDCIDQSDEVHVISSTTGFEALLRGKNVVTYGSPFYAGWGLTTDKISYPRRNRALQLWQLVSVALDSYPRYFNWSNGRFCDSLTVLQLLKDIKTGVSPQLFYNQKLQRIQKRIKHRKELLNKIGI